MVRTSTVTLPWLGLDRCTVKANEVVPSAAVPSSALTSSMEMVGVSWVTAVHSPTLDTFGPDAAIP